MIDPWPKLQLLVRAELLRVRIASRVAVSRASHVALGAVLALGALGMFLLAGFVWLQERLGTVTAALVSGAILLLAGGAMFVLGQRVRPGPEAALVDELESLARAGLEADLAQIRVRVERVEHALAHPFGGAEGLATQLSLILGVISSVLARRRRERGSPEQTETSEVSEATEAEV